MRKCCLGRCSLSVHWHTLTPPRQTAPLRPKCIPRQTKHPRLPSGTYWTPPSCLRLPGGAFCISLHTYPDGALVTRSHSIAVRLFLGAPLASTAASTTNGRHPLPAPTDAKRLSPGSKSYKADDALSSEKSYESISSFTHDRLLCLTNYSFSLLSRSLGCSWLLCSWVSP